MDNEKLTIRNKLAKRDFHIVKIQFPTYFGTFERVSEKKENELKLSPSVYVYEFISRLANCNWSVSLCTGHISSLEIIIVKGYRGVERTLIC